MLYLRRLLGRYPDKRLLLCKSFKKIFRSNRIFSASVEISQLH